MTGRPAHSATVALEPQHLPANAEQEQHRHRDRQEPPRGDPERHERGLDGDPEHDARGDPPVVADDEVPPEAAERLTRASPGPTGSAAAPQARDQGERDEQDEGEDPGSAASEPGQCAPAPSAVQKIPNVVSITPTANFIAFSGTRASGRPHGEPDAVTSDDRCRGAGGGERDAALRRCRT